MKDSYFLNVTFWLITILAVIIVGLSGAYTMDIMSASCQLCAMDLVICIGGGRVIAAILLPLIILIYMIFILNYKFQYHFLTKSGSRKKFLMNILVCALKYTVMFVTLTLLVMFFIGLISFGKVCNYSDMSSMFRDELNATGMYYISDYSILGFLIKSFVINVLEVYTRVMAGLLIYISFEKGAISVMALLGISIVIPFRMERYLKLWGYKAEAGAFYTEMLRNDLYFKGVMGLFIVMLLLVLLQLLIVRRKSFYKI